MNNRNVISNIYIYIYIYISFNFDILVAIPPKHECGHGAMNMSSCEQLPELQKSWV